MVNDYMSMKEAMAYLGVSKVKMGKLVKEKGLKIFTDPLDERKNLLLRTDVEILKHPILSS